MKSGYVKITFKLQDLFQSRELKWKLCPSLCHFMHKVLLLVDFS